VQSWLDPTEGSVWSITGGVPDALDKVWTSYPAEIDFQQWPRVQPPPTTHAQAVVFIGRQSDSREGMSPWKRVTLGVQLQVFCQSFQLNPEDAMADVDTIHDQLHDRITSSHTLGQPQTVIFEAAEPGISSTFGEPMQDESGASQIWFQLAFDVVTFYLT
jgi:hypothetical protein